MLKAFAIYEHPEYVAHGKLSKELRTHQLGKLWKASKFVPYKMRFTPVVSALEDGLESWARYPCGLTHDRQVFELSMTEQLWEGYSRMFTACGQRLEKLLTKGWTNASGERARMEYS